MSLGAHLPAERYVKASHRPRARHGGSLRRRRIGCACTEGIPFRGESGAALCPAALLGAVMRRDSPGNVNAVADLRANYYGDGHNVHLPNEGLALNQCERGGAEAVHSEGGISRAPGHEAELWLAGWMDGETGRQYFQ